MLVAPMSQAENPVEVTKDYTLWACSERIVAIIRRARSLPSLCYEVEPCGTC